MKFQRFNLSGILITAFGIGKYVAMDELTCMVGGSLEVVKGMVVMSLVYALLITVKFFEGGMTNCWRLFLLFLLG